MDIQPYSLRPKEAAKHFGFAESTLSNWICQGRLIRGVHYYKVGARVLIITEAFIDWLREQDGQIEN